MVFSRFLSMTIFIPAENTRHSEKSGQNPGHLGHPRVTIARQSDWALFTLGLLLPVIIPAIACIEHTPPAQIITNYYL
jgi:hypothetical protein